MTLLKNRGSILITTLWIMAILSLLAMGIGFRVSLETRLSRYNINMLQVRYLARAGIMKAMEYLKEDTNEFDTLYECGIILNKRENETPQILFGAETNRLGSGSFSIRYLRNGNIYYGMSDEERRININMDKLTSNNTAEYKRILDLLYSNFIDASLSEEIINAMIDWQDRDSSPRTPGGEERYEYGCKNGDFELVEEALLIKGMAKDIFDKLKDYITVYTDGKININTAPRQVLNAIINDEVGSYTLLIDKIIIYRSGDDGIEATEDDRPIQESISRLIQDLNATPGLELTEPEAARLTSLANYFVFKSNNFRIVSHADIHRITKVIIYVVERGQEPVKYYHEE